MRGYLLHTKWTGAFGKGIAPMPMGHGSIFDDDVPVVLLTIHEIVFLYRG